MPRKGNGTVGIWCYEANSVMIQHCLSFQNKTSQGGEDGGGYDFDGGTTNSIIQYCLSYENQGSAFGIFQYDGASAGTMAVCRLRILPLMFGTVRTIHYNSKIFCFTATHFTMKQGMQLLIHLKVSTAEFIFAITSLLLK